VLPGVIGFNDERIVANTIGLLAGGVETTSAAIALVVDELLQRPEQLATACAAAASSNDTVLAAHVWEALRFHPINPFVARFCEQDFIVADGTPRKATIRAGTVVLASTAAGMMDDDELDSPEEFRLNRPYYHYMHFGYGAHTCRGDQVSMVQIPAIIKHLLLKNLRRAADPRWAGGFPEWAVSRKICD
jgi:cytochrome P450